ncbi:MULTISPECIES: DUF3192 domain-containing protein [Thalassotalea]|uniref:DUF3192 domain-containing protein n=1 Tax=Thalassotalea castellviae TaxID=3075612 RepID=A0ABU2ZWI9_9GAMM|nr:DUF3192 domain-containing protein [Thalassotalea sp. W431]MDT0602284.1 DUF3192 domain-containing protein [Thalassotalea sp. W431]
MKKSILALIIAAPLTLSLTGCVVSVGGDDGYNMSSDYENREYTNRKKISRIALNSSIIDVTNRLGVADFNETYEKDGNAIRVLFYRTNRIHKDGLTTRDECTYLYFVNGELVETGQGGDFSRNISR